MVKPKPINYPNMVNAIKALASAHESIHKDVATHAARHQERIANLRTQRAVQLTAKKLIEGDGAK